MKKKTNFIKKIKSTNARILILSKNYIAKIHPFMNNDFRYLMQSAYFETDGSRKGELNIIKTKLNKKLLTLFLGYDPENFENLISRKYWEVGIILSSKYRVSKNK